jgi:hypothetical protein
MRTQYIKDNKIYNLPIEIKTKDGITYTNDENLLKEYGFEKYVYVEPKKSLETLINESNDAINASTDEKILNGFTFDGHEFYLTMENQTNFANMFIAREYLEYPQKVKTKTGFMELPDADEVGAFYLAGVYFIKQCIEAGWVEKTEAEKQIREEYNK